jgi:hypothetical protein
MQARRPVVVINPRSDATFVALTEELMMAGMPTISDLERQLRNQYPRAVVRERGLAGESTTTWYVYREGTWVPSET